MPGVASRVAYQLAASESRRSSVPPVETSLSLLRAVRLIFVSRELFLFRDIAKIRGCVRGVSSEFVLACDMRFASRENTLLGNPKSGWE
jgi:hypothetical protein